MYICVLNNYHKNLMSERRKVDRRNNKQCSISFHVDSCMYIVYKQSIEKKRRLKSEKNEKEA